MMRMNDELTQSFVLGAFALALILSCRSLLNLALGTHQSRGSVQGVFAAAGLAVTVILAADALRSIDYGGSLLEALLGLTICGLALLTLPLHTWVASLRLPAHELLVRPAPWLILLWSLGACGWSGVRFYEIAAPKTVELTSNPRPVLEVERQAIAVSDRGRPIPLFHMRAEVAGWPAGFQATTSGLQRMMQTVICRGGPDASSNCHGWIFAAGEYLVDGSGVEIILDDNGYEPCTAPQPGDLIVYWSGRYVAHTGMVSAVLADNTVLIESKWNLQERFLHRPEDQPYSREFTYYRTPRGSHQITIRR
jgi:hypothetical protein